MSATKVAISMDETLLQRSFRSRSQMVQEAVSEKISRMDKSALARECTKLDRKSEQAMADEGLATEISAWLTRARSKPLHYRPLEDYLAERTGQ